MCLWLLWTLQNIQSESVLHESVVLPWSCVSVPAPNSCPIGSQRERAPIRSCAQEARPHESSVRRPCMPQPQTRGGAAVCCYGIKWAFVTSCTAFFRGAERRHLPPRDRDGGRFSCFADADLVLLCLGCVDALEI